MKFQKLSLDESLFGDSLSWSVMPDCPSHQVLTMYDDEFVGTDLPKEMLNGPESGSDAAATDMILSAINEELETIRNYNSIIESLKYESTSNSEYESFINIIKDINAEENKHVGQLQEILQKLSPNAQFIDKGRDEGKQQFEFTNGLLNVQSWENKSAQTTTNPDVDLEMCTLQDTDDEM